MEVTSPFAWSFFLIENYTNHAKTQSYGHLLATADCPPMGHQYAIMLNFTDFKACSGKVAPVLCFWFDQQRPYYVDRGIEENVGCPYQPCRIHDVRTVRNNEIIIQGPFQGHNFYCTPTGTHGLFGINGSLPGLHQSGEPCI